METKEMASFDVLTERALRYAQKICVVYRKSIVKDIEDAPDGVEKRMLAGTVAMELVDIATDLYAIASLNTVACMPTPESKLKKLKELLDGGVEGFAEATHTMLLIAIRDSFKDGHGIGAPKQVNDSLVEALNEYITVRQAIQFIKAGE